MIWLQLQPSPYSTTVFPASSTESPLITCILFIIFLFIIPTHLLIRFYNPNFRNSGAGTFPLNVRSVNRVVHCVFLKCCFKLLYNKQSKKKCTEQMMKTEPVQSYLWRMNAHKQNGYHVLHHIPQACYVFFPWPLISTSYKRCAYKRLVQFLERAVCFSI